jgi:hypothetical protein
LFGWVRNAALSDVWVGLAVAAAMVESASSVVVDDALPVPGLAGETQETALMGELVATVPQWLEDVIQRYAGDERGNPEFEAVVASGAKAESGWNPSKIQIGGGGGRGLFQFDIFGGMGSGVPLSNLFSADYQASRIVPIYNQQYKRFKSAGQSGADLAASTAGASERPFGYSAATGTLARGTTAWNNYVAAWQQVTSGLSLQAQTTTDPQTGAVAHAGDGGAGGGGGGLDFGGSLWHVLVSAGLVLLALVLIIGGVVLLTTSKAVEVVTSPGGQQMARGAAAAGV